ncbi:MAG: hypothetical protein ACYCYM_01910 [Saccharofermentanales bacterium]
MKNPSIIYWKWDDSHIESGKYLEEIDDIIDRSCFDHIYITTHWCHEGITSANTYNAIKKACDHIHAKGRKVIFEIDFRAEKHVFIQNNPDKRLGFIYWKEVVLNDSGLATTGFRIRKGDGGELFLGNTQCGEELLRVYSYNRISDGYVPGTVSEITEDCVLMRRDFENVDVRISSDTSKNKNVLILAVSWFEFNDLFSKENDRFFQHLLENYQTIPLDGIALDEMGYPWHVDFDFSPSTYLTWNNSPYFSWSMQKKYCESYHRDYLEDCLNRFIGSAPDDKEQMKAINYYFEFIRKEIVRIERLFYDQGKKIFGSMTFIGVHPTWYAIEETQNTPEVWKNGIDWWEVPRDYGFTDEIMIYPVRLALTHKANASIFYNMWYSEATLCSETFFSEIFRNFRYGGRTISLSYECVNEDKIVMQLKEKGILELVSQAEEMSRLLDQFQSSPAASDILIIMGIPASCNYLSNMDGKGDWNHYKNKFKDAFELANNIWNSGYNCDLVASYEIDNNCIFLDDEGDINYGNQKFHYVIIINPDFCKRSMLDFIDDLVKTEKNVAFIGQMGHDFDGEDVAEEFQQKIAGYPFFSGVPESSDIIPLFERCHIESNRVCCGSKLQDGMVIFTSPSPTNPSGNYFESHADINNHLVIIKANDFAAISMDKSGELIRLVSPGLYELIIDSICLYRFSEPQVMTHGLDT